LRSKGFASNQEIMKLRLVVPVLFLSVILVNLVSLKAEGVGPIYGIGFVAVGDTPSPKPPAPWGEGIIQDHIVVSSLIPGGPAGKSGVKQDDEIIQVDDRKVAGMTLKDVCNLLRGPEGTSVKIAVKREGESSLLSFTITRALVFQSKPRQVQGDKPY